MGKSDEKRKACENDDMVVKERSELLDPSFHEDPGNSGLPVYQNGKGQNLGCYYVLYGRGGGVFNGPGQKTKKIKNKKKLLVIQHLSW
jgi:hypothetical protein